MKEMAFSYPAFSVSEKTENPFDEDDSGVKVFLTLSGQQQILSPLIEGKGK